jgi:hypothetical protein
METDKLQTYDVAQRPSRRRAPTEPVFDSCGELAAADATTRAANATVQIIQSLPEGDRPPGHREFSRFRTRSGRKRLCPAVHPRAKENLLRVRSFETIEELRQALLAIRETYNTNWLIERHGFIMRTAFRQTQLQLLAKAA